MIPFEVQTGKFPDMEKRWLQPCVDFSAHEFYRAQKWHGVPANKNQEVRFGNPHEAFLDHCQKLFLCQRFVVRSLSSLTKPTLEELRLFLEKVRKGVDDPKIIPKCNGNHEFMFDN